MINIALFGPPGAGKGTQSKLLLEKYNLAYIATGDILRKEISDKTDLGLKAKEIIEKGGLVSDEIIVQIIERTIIENQHVNGFLFDGFPRTFVQAYILEGLLLKLNTSLTCMISLSVPREELLNRLLERSKTSQRIDDTPDVILTRLTEYELKTAHVADFYKERGFILKLMALGKLKMYSTDSIQPLKPCFARSG
jgi:adenylate kinase